MTSVAEKIYTKEDCEALCALAVAGFKSAQKFIHTKNLDSFSSLRALLPMAEAYLQDAPNHPDNVKLDTARALLKSGVHTTTATMFTEREKKALRAAIGFVMSGETDDMDVKALESAREKL